MTGHHPTSGRGGRQRIPRPARTLPGVAPWWAVPGLTPPRLSVADVRAAFPGGADDGPGFGGAVPLTGRELPMPDGRPAAVLCAVWDEEGTARVLLTRRSARLRSHTGEIAFPGGRLEPGEGALEAALREAEEEVGLDPAAVEVLGRLPALTTVSSAATITPFVGVLPGRPQLVANPHEVELVLTPTLGELLAPGCYHGERWDTGDGVLRDIHFFEVPGDTVWGATARMLCDLLDLLLPEPPELAAGRTTAAGPVTWND